MYDLCVIGGGINGAGVARDAAGRGLSVLLLEAGDLASGTSSASTKLIHGGLRYLENYDFKLVRESLQERRRLFQIAPHLITPLKIILPHRSGQRPYWLIRLGLFIYDRLGGGSGGMPKSQKVRFDHTSPLNTTYHKGFFYYDGWTDDAALVRANALDAEKRGAVVLTQCPVQSLKADKAVWHIGTPKGEFQARTVVNATGPWARQVLESTGLTGPDVPQMRLVKGSHIIVPRQYAGGEAYILQQPDGRIVFVIPYQGKFTLIGTTEEEYTGDPGRAVISPAETDYLCDAYNRDFKATITPADITRTYSGVRPLFDDGQDSATKASRDHRIYHHTDQSAPLLSIFGGKLTTFRLVAEQTVDQLCGLLDHKVRRWTADEKLP